MSLPSAAAGAVDPAQFDELAAALLCPDPALDRTTLYLAAETSDFLRFNEGALRQATHVRQAALTLALESGRRRVESTLTLAGDPALDVPRLVAERDELKALLRLVPDDPWLQRPAAPAASRRDDAGRLPEPARVIALVHEHARVQRSLDLVGFYAGGPVVRAFADSLGSRHWHRIESFHFDWCIYRHGDKAVKTRLAGTHWDDAEFVARLDEAARRAPLLDRSPLPLAPGAYRAAFAPDAVGELVSMLGWGGFSLKQRRTGVSPLVRLERGEAFAAGFDLDEATGAGIAPAFTAEGFVRPERVALVERGRLPDSGGTLNSPRSALEYGVPTNGAQASEAPESLRLAPGKLAAGELLRALDTGLYVGHLWYLNFSDRQACRMTGMTRFACLWVERGTPVAPVEVMRFDDDALRLFGPGLEALASESEFVPNGDTVGARTPGSVTVPAALVEGFRLTL